MANPHHDEKGKFAPAQSGVARKMRGEDVSPSYKTPAFTVARTAYEHLNNEMKRLGEVLRKFPKGPTGLTPDHIRNSPEYRTAKAAYDAAFQKARNFNEKYNQQFAAEIKEERRARGR